MSSALDDMYDFALCGEHKNYPGFN